MRKHLFRGIYADSRKSSRPAAKARCIFRATFLSAGPRRPCQRRFRGSRQKGKQGLSGGGFLLCAQRLCHRLCLCLVRLQDLRTARTQVAHRALAQEVIFNFHRRPQSPRLSASGTPRSVLAVLLSPHCYGVRKLTFRATGFPSCRVSAATEHQSRRGGQKRIFHG